MPTGSKTDRKVKWAHRGEDREGRRGAEDADGQVGAREARGSGREGGRDTGGGQARFAAGEARLRIAF